MRPRTPIQLPLKVILTTQVLLDDFPFLFKYFLYRYPIIYSNGKDFIANATVFDLDPKLYPQHFLKFVKKTREAFSAYKCYLETKAT